VFFIRGAGLFQNKATQPPKRLFTLHHPLIHNTGVSALPNLRPMKEVPMLARSGVLPVLLFVLFPITALADETRKEKPKLEEPPITIVRASFIARANVYSGSISGTPGVVNRAIVTTLYGVQIVARANRRLSEAHYEVRWYDKSDNQVFDKQTKIPKGPTVIGWAKQVEAGETTTVRFNVPDAPGITSVKGTVIDVRSTGDRFLWHPPKDLPMTFEAKVSKQAKLCSGNPPYAA
jgi:hypothetical protein